MRKRLLLSMLSGGIAVASSCTAMGQEAKPASDDCSGFMCKLFGSRLDDHSSQQASPLPGADKLAASSAKKRPLKAAKATPVVSIAADGAEGARLKVLAAALPKTRVHIVAASGNAADFIVAPAFDGAAPSEKARLFTEQLHVVAGPGIRSFDDLKDKVVSFGPDKSPAQVAARRAFAALGLSVKETPLDLENALDGLATGDVAAAVVLAPQPDARLTRLKTTAGLHLVSWPDNVAAPAGASVTAIPGSFYPGLAKSNDSIRTLGIEAALDASGKGATSPAAKAFLAALSQHSAALSKRGFDLIKADLEMRNGSRVASAERR